LSISPAAYRIIEELEKYNNIGDLQNAISSLAIQRYASNQMTAPRDEAITAMLDTMLWNIR
jgi:transcriptional regulator with AAA-type ATPase domain